MSFTSVEFILLVTAAVVLYYLVPKRFQWIVLLAANYIFYLCGGVLLTGYLLAATVCTYAAGLALERLNAKKGQLDKNLWKRRKKSVAAAALIFNFGMLYVVKYLDGTLEVLSQIAGRPVTQINILVPLGISYYIFQSCGYVIDCYRGKYAVEHNIGHYALFVSFFPQMVQGPISRFDQLAPQLTAERKLCWDDLQIGIQLALWGYFKKIVIADRAAVLVNNVIMENCPYGGAVIALGILFYCIQLYCDFSGGIDITRGVARMFGIDMTLNFRRPLFSTSLTDYWRRCNITLGAWMRAYGFYPLAFSKPFGKLGKWARKHFKGMMGKICATSTATFIVYLIIGIWHGANFRYIAFGLWNGILITASLLMERRFLSWKEKLHINDKSTGWRIFMTVRTFGLVFIGRYFTRAPRLKTVFTLLGTTVLHPHFSEFTSVVPTLGLGISDFIIIFVGILIVHGVEFFEERGTDVQTWLNERPALMQLTVLTVSLVVLLLFGIFRAGYISSEFIYKQF